MIRIMQVFNANRLLAWLFIIGLFSLHASCTLEQKRSANALPPARGGKGEVVVVMDSAKWSTELGEATRGVFADPLPALPQPEPIFSLTSVTSSQFKSILQQCRNIVIVTTFDSDSRESRLLQQYFTGQSRERMKSEPDLFMVKQEDVFANGQLVVYLFAQTEEALMQKMEENKEMLQELFQSRENDAVREKLLARDALNQDLMQAVRNKHGIGLKIPAGFKVAKDEEGFLWLRLDEGKYDQNILISHRPYTSEDAFKNENVLKWRNDLGKKHIYADQENKPDSYMITEMKVPVYYRVAELGGQYAKEMKGLWRLNKVFLGGAFQSYCVASPENGQIYYIEAFLAAPGSSKREQMRELQLVLQSVFFPEAKS